MRARSAPDFARLVGGTYVGPPDLEVRGIATDSRALQPGEAYFALPGERVDGHDFCAAALAAGAPLVVVERDPGEAAPHVRVASTVESLADLGRGLLAEMPCKVFALTGSVGKTTTREMLAAILSTQLSCYAAPGNWNTEIGVPLALAAAPPDVDALVLEYGMRGLGQIRTLVQIAPPDVAAVLNVRSTHIELLGSRNAIAEAKAEIFAGAPYAVCCINRDDDYADLMLARAEKRALTFGLDPRSDVRAREVRAGAEATGFLLEHAGRARSVSIPAPGEHLVQNALCAAAMAIAGGADDLALIESGLAAFRPARGRGEVHRLTDGLVVVDDSYNAAPDSMAAALRSLAGREVAGRRVAILGDMLELGEHSGAAHREAGQLAARSGLGLLIAVGERGRGIAEAALAAGMEPSAVACVADAAEAAELIAGLVRSGDTVLVKASRGIHLETVVEALREGRSL